MNQLKAFRLLLIIGIAFVSTALLAQNLNQFIPADSKMVFSMHPKNLNAKVDIKKLWEREFVSTMMMFAGMGVGEDEKAKLAFQVFSNPSEYGIDLMDNSYFFMTPSENGVFVNILVKISDNQKFSDLLNDFGGEESDKTVDKGGYKAIFNDESGFAWNKDMALISVFSEPDDEIMGKITLKKGTTPTSFVDKIMTGKEKSITTNAKFVKASQKPADMRMWADAAYFQEIAGGESGIAAMNPMSSMWGNDGSISMDLNFNNGEIVMGSTSYLDSEGAKLMKNMVNVKINPSFLKYVDKNDFLGYFTAGYNVNEIISLFKKGLGDDFPEDEIESGLSSMGLNWKKEDLYNLFKGDVMIALTGVKEVTREVTDYDYDEEFNKTETKKMTTQPFPEFVMMMSYNNEAKLKELLDLGVEQAFIAGGKGNYLIDLPTMSEKVTLTLKKGVLLITNDADLKGKTLKKGFKKKNLLSGEHLNRIYNNSTAIYWNATKTIDAFEQVLPTDKQSVMAIDAFRKTVESVIITTDKGTGDTFNGAFEIHMPSKKENALDQIFDLIDEVFSGAMSGSNM